MITHPKLKLTLTELPDGSFDIGVPSHNLDAHLEPTEDGWVLDIFNGRCQDGPDAQVGVLNVTLLPSGEIDWHEVVNALREFPVQ